MLKFATAREEKHGGRVLADWQNGPFVEVWAHDADAVLMTRAQAAPTLAEMSATDDFQAVCVLCDVARGIHASHGPIGLTPLDIRFKDLFEAPSELRFEAGKAAARALLDTPQDRAPLHGDLHHGNVLYFEGVGWKAIDPKGVIGERGFDFANIFCNPSAAIALRHGLFEARLADISKLVDIAPSRLAQWVVAWTALSAVWSCRSGDDPSPTLEIGTLAAVNLRE